MQLLEEDKKKIKGALYEISNSKTRIEAENDLVKEILKNLYDEFKIPKKTLAKLANTYHKQNFNEEVALNDEFEVIYQTVTNNGTDD
jgi:hypothetical protein